MLKLRLLLPTMVAVLLTGCESLSFAVANLPAFAPRRGAELRYAPGPRGGMDVYLPPAQAAPRGVPVIAPVPAVRRPLVIFWYGGGFTAGEKNDYRFAGAGLAATGHVTVLPDYRLYPQVRFPDFLKDAAHAVVQAQHEAARLGADPQRVVLAGHSAGAYIAAMLALQPKYLRDAGGDPGWIVGLIGMSGPYDIDPDTAVLDAIFRETAAPDEFKPLRQVTPAAPPALLLHGQADTRVSVRHAESLASALVAAGVRVRLQVYAGRKHADTVAALSRLARSRAPVIAEVSAFLDSLDAAQPLSSSPSSSSSSSSPR